MTKLEAKAATKQPLSIRATGISGWAHQVDLALMCSPPLITVAAALSPRCKMTRIHQTTALHNNTKPPSARRREQPGTKHRATAAGMQLCVQPAVNRDALVVPNTRRVMRMCVSHSISQALHEAMQDGSTMHAHPPLLVVLAYKA